MRHLNRNQRAIIFVAVVLTIISGIISAVHGAPVLLFLVSGGALAMLASTVGASTEELGERLGPGATGVLQSALGNLPELFVSIFALRQGLITVVQAALVGSILANTLLVLGLAFLFGGLKNGCQTFGKQQPRMIASLMLLSIAALIVPSLTAQLGTPAGHHPRDLSIAVSIILLVIFASSIPFSLRGGSELSVEAVQPTHGASWPLSLSIGVLVMAGVGAAFVSDWFVDALTPAMQILHLSPAFTGLVIVAIAGNAVENVVGIQLAVKNQMDYAISVILNSSLQIALGLMPMLVLLSLVLGGGHVLTLVLPPMLLICLFLACLVSAMIVYDGESVWLEGVALIGLYLMIAASFWWG